MFGMFFNKPVDLVYLWCDGNDPEFTALRNEWLLKEGAELNHQATSESRWAEIEELKYSLRSADKYVPWINHIFIVTNGQVPKWLNLENEKISIVTHDQILPADALPTFNSSAIEAGLTNIPDLSEYFLLANDDTFFNRPIKKSFFFSRKGCPIVRMKPKKLNPNDLYDNWIKTAQDKIKEKYGKEYPFETHHNIDGYRKSDYRECMDTFAEEFSQTRYHHFRHHDTIHRTIINLFSLAKGRGYLKNVILTPLQKKLGKFHIAKLDSMYLSNRDNIGKILRRYKPALFCLNDVTSSTNDDRRNTKRFLEKYFPFKSQFEK